MTNDKWNIIRQMTEGCSREDCKIESKGYGISNSAGSSDFWSCLSCRREWSVRHPASHERTTYDKLGNASAPKQLPPEVREIMRPPMVAANTAK